MSRDPAKWGFLIWPSQKFTKFYKGKDLRLLELNKVGIFEIGPVFLKLRAFEIFQ